MLASAITSPPCLAPMSSRARRFAPVIELYHHSVRAGQFNEACNLYLDRLRNPLYYRFGAYQLIIAMLVALFPKGEKRLPNLGAKDQQAAVLSELANAYSSSGQPHRTLPLYKRDININRMLTLTGPYYRNAVKRNLAVGLLNIATMSQFDIGSLRAAEDNLRRGIAMSQELKDNYIMGECYHALARVLFCRGSYAEAEKWVIKQLQLRKECEAHDMNILPPHTYRISYFYFQHFMPANSFRSLFSSLDSALQALQASEQHVNELVPGDNRETSLSEGSFIEYYTYLGSAYLSLNSHDAAERTLHTALERCRRISQVSCEARSSSNFRNLPWTPALGMRPSV